MYKSSGYVRSPNFFRSGVLGTPPYMRRMRDWLANYFRKYLPSLIRHPSRGTRSEPGHASGPSGCRPRAPVAAGLGPKITKVKLGPDAVVVPEANIDRWMLICVIAINGRRDARKCPCDPPLYIDMMEKNRIDHNMIVLNMLEHRTMGPRAGWTGDAARCSHGVRAGGRSRGGLGPRASPEGPTSCTITTSAFSTP